MKRPHDTTLVLGLLIDKGLAMPCSFVQLLRWIHFHFDEAWPNPQLQSALRSLEGLGWVERRAPQKRLDGEPGLKGASWSSTPAGLERYRVWQRANPEAS